MFEIQKFYQRMKVSPEARRLAKYKKKKRIQRRDATIRRYVLYANTMRAIFTSEVNSYGHCGTVSSPNHTFSWAGLNKRLTSNSCTYFR